jgi:hypothetical protein
MRKTNFQPKVAIEASKGDKTIAERGFHLVGAMTTPSSINLA